MNSFSSLGKAATDSGRAGATSCTLSTILSYCWPTKSDQEEEQESLAGSLNGHRVVQKEDDPTLAVWDISQQKRGVLQEKIKEITQMEQRIMSAPNAEEAKQLLEIIERKDRLESSFKEKMRSLTSFEKQLSKDPAREQELAAVLDQKKSINSFFKPVYERIRALKQKINQDPTQKEVAKLLSDLELANQQARNIIKEINWLERRAPNQWTSQDVKDLEDAKESFLKHKITIPATSRETNNQGNSKKLFPSILKQESSFKNKQTAFLSQPSSQNKRIGFPENDEDIDDGGMGEIFKDVGDP